MSFYFQKLVVKLPFRIFYRVFKSNLGQSLLKIQKLDLVNPKSIQSKFNYENFHNKIHESRLLILLRDYYDTFYYQKIHRSSLDSYIKFECLDTLNETLKLQRPIILY